MFTDLQNLAKYLPEIENRYPACIGELVKREFLKELSICACEVLRRYDDESDLASQFIQMIKIKSK